MGIIEKTKLDLLYFNSMKDSKPIKNALDNEKLNYWEDFVSDIFSSLYKINPKIKDSINKSELINKRIMSQLMEMKEWKVLREYTVLDEFSSSVATEEIVKIIEIPDELKNKINEAKKLENEINNINEMIDSMKLYNKEVPNELINQLIELENSYNNINIDQSEIELNYEFRNKIRESLNKLNEDLENERDLIPIWGIEKGKIIKTDYNERYRLFQIIRNDKKLKKIIELVGRFKRIVNSNFKYKIKHNTGYINEITLGNDISKIIPCELVQLKNNLLKKNFYNKFIERKLMIYDNKSKEKIGKGPICLLIDSSGSMKGPRDIWAKAITLSFYYWAILEKRKIFIVLFGNSSELKEFEFPINKFDIEKTIEFCQFMFGGGTNFETPLRKSVEYIKNNKKSDIIMITDGECDISSNFLKEFKNWKIKNEIRLIAILVQNFATETLWKKLTDTIYKVSDITKDNEEIKNILNL